MSFKKIKVGIIGTGNIGTDLLVKINRSKLLECRIFAGKNPDSKGIKKAKKMGIPTSSESINAIERNPQCCEIVFDATSAKAHFFHAPILRQLGKFTIDMTPSRIGEMCIPIINLKESLQKDNVNMITCGAQSTVPIILAMKRVHPDIDYVEVVASIASKSAGIGTRENIDEYTQATAEGIRSFTNIPNAKAIIVLNPANPPILMNNTIYASIKNPNIAKLTKEIKKVEKEIKTYVPGFKVLINPVFENNRVTTILEVRGLGDFLPIYAGNLDIINCAAVAVAEEYARHKILQT